MFSSDKLMHLDAFVINEFFNLYCELIESNIYMTKDNKDIRIDPKEVDYYLSLGYTRGQSVLKGRTPWNKGLTKDDPRVMDNAEKRNETMLKRYGTLNGNIFKNKETE